MTAQANFHTPALEVAEDGETETLAGPMDGLHCRHHIQGHPNGLRDSVVDCFVGQRAEWAICVPVCADIAVARRVAEPQNLNDLPA
ncbi:hypothetical protein BH11PSE10_BH11PSE10_17970 [soil metagenome]